MKKLVFVLLALCFAIHAYTVELWNGFTTDMSKEQTLRRCLELFSTNKPRSERKDEIFGIGYHYSGAKVDESLFFTTNTPAYPTVVTRFLNDKLCAIEVWWGSDDVQLLINRHKEQFGQPDETKSSKRNYYSALIRGNYAVTHTDYKWQKQERYIYLETWIDPVDLPSSEKYKNAIKSIFVDRTVCDAWQVEYDRAQRQKAEEEEAKKKAATEGIKF